PDIFGVEIPPIRVEQAHQAAAIAGRYGDKFPWAGNTQAVDSDAVTQLLKRTWSATLSVVAADGIPTLGQGGNVLRTHSALALSIRTPPTLDCEAVNRQLTELLCSDPPCNATVSFQSLDVGQGWNAAAEAPWLIEALDGASNARFANDCVLTGEGGSIPLLADLQQRFPNAQFLVTGVLGPGSNAHGPNEFLHLPMVKAVTEAVARTLLVLGARG
ncbi:peptidase M20, partial [Gammaproteobacteria bacterium]|nr:peptidase M20 [Gammaproteobacteria bacterium]